MTHLFVAGLAWMAGFFPAAGPAWMAGFLYLLKVSLISGLLYGYYRIFLRNRLFHQYNRCYLLGIALASFILPLVHLPAGPSFWVIGQAPTLSDALHTITLGDWKETLIPGSGPGLPPALLSWQELAAGVYVLASGVLFIIFFRQLYYIARLRGFYPRERMGGLHFFMTKEPGSPFSFLNNIFWNDQLDIDSSHGQQIFRHELYHVRQWHTLDLLLMKPLMILFWINPFFYLIYRELKTIHEFQADRYALSGGDRYEYAELLVWQTIDKPHPSLLHPFFHSSIKRRITMLTQFKTTTPGFASRVMVLPLLFLLFCAFGSKLCPQEGASLSRSEGSFAGVPARSGDRLSEAAAASLPFTVVIDAGHGGIDMGAVTSAGVPEKGIDLALALKVKQLGAEYHVNVLLTRDDDQLAGGKRTIRESLRYRTEMANKSKADLFVSLHTDANGREANANGGENTHGFHIYVSPDNRYYSQSVRLGSTLIDALKGDYATGQDLIESKQGVWVLRESAMPAVLVLCGNISDPTDLAFVGKEANQEKIARDLLQGIVRYKQGQAGLRTRQAAGQAAGK